MTKIIKPTPKKNPPKSSRKTPTKRTSSKKNTKTIPYSYLSPADFRKQYAYIESYYYQKIDPQVEHWKQKMSPVERGFIVGFVSGSALMLFLVMAFFIY